jgi:hypothetical protein
VGVVVSETKTFDATIIRAGEYRTLRQPIRYENGRAVAYRCPDCHGLHPLHQRDWDEARGVYAGRDCGAGPPRIVAVRAAKNAYQREYYATHPEFRDRQRQRAREWQRARRAEAARRAAQGGPR